MSAAEKLKALVERLNTELPAPVDAAQELLDVLPQIVALVKVLACSHSDPDNSGRCIKCQATLDEGQPWDDALAALDEALGEQA